MFRVQTNRHASIDHHCLYTTSPLDTDPLRGVHSLQPHSKILSVQVYQKEQELPSEDTYPKKTVLPKTLEKYLGRSRSGGFS